MDQRKGPKSRTVISITSIAVAAILSVTPFLSYAAVVAPTPGVDWITNGNAPSNFNYSPQTAITASNVKSLVPKWVFPVPAAPPPFVGAEGSIVTPLVVGGIAYIITNWHRVFALDAASGKVLWFKDLPVITNSSTKLFAGFTNHYHDSDMVYTTNIGNTPLLWIFANTYQLYALNALTGDIVTKLTTLKLSEAGPGAIPGNYGYYKISGPSGVIDEKTGILVTGAAVNEGTEAGRGFIEGFDLTSTPAKLLWRVFTIPPNDGSDPNWSLKSVQNMSHAWIFAQDHVVDLKALPQAQLQSLLVGDWGKFAFNGTRSYGGNGLGWGGAWAIDEDTGIAYISTNQPSPYTNATFRPGPNLWSVSILAVDMKTGKFVWGFQGSPHDVWDWDCSWSAMLATVNVNGSPTKVVFKGCKEGVFFALDAATGKMLWFLKAPSTTYSKCTLGTNGKPLLDPLNKDDMTKYNWPCWPSGKNSAQYPFVVSDPANTGAIESDPAFDPVTSTAFVATFNKMVTYSVVPVGPGTPYFENRGRSATKDLGTPNSTIYALDAATGQTKWTYFIPGLPYRGGLTTSGGVVYATTADGTLWMLDVKTGSLINKYQVGGPLIIQPAIGKDANGDVKLIVPSTGGFWAPNGNVPGYVIAFGLPSSAQQVTTTQVLTSTFVSRTTTSTGVDPTTLYAAVGVAVIFIITTGVLAVRRRTPAS